MVVAVILFLAFNVMAADGDLAWVKQIGGMDPDFSYRIVVDNAANRYITGAFSTTVDFDPNAGIVNLTSAGGFDAYMWTLNGPGNYTWAKRLGGTSNDYSMEIALDGEYNVYVTGWFAGTSDFDPGSGTYNLTSAGANDIFVAKYDNSGNFLWANAMGGPGDDWGYGIRVDNSGNVYTSGSFTGTADFDPGSNVYNLTSAGGLDVFISKLNSDGDFEWAIAMGGPGEDRTWCLSLDGGGNTHITGSFSGTADFDPDSGVYNRTSQGGTDIFVAKYNSPGNLVWANAMGGPDDDFGRAIDVDSSTNSCTTGYFKGTADFDPTSGTVEATSNGGYDVFVWKLNSAGNLIWGKSVGGTGDDMGLGVSYDMLGCVYTTGSFNGTADFDPGSGTSNLTSAGNTDVFVLKVDNEGDLVWAKKMGGTDSDSGNGIDVDGAGGVYVTGGFRLTGDFDPGPGTVNLTSAGFNDAFVLKLSGPPDTTPPNCTQINPSTTGPTNATSISFEVIFNEYITGFNDIADLVITRTGDVTNTGVTITGNEYRYTVTLSGISGNGTLSLAASITSDIKDLAGLALATSVTSAEVIIDNTPPPNAIAIWPSTTGPTSETSISFRVVFDKPVQGFDNTADLVIDLVGAITYGTVSISGTGTLFTVVFSDFSGTGTIRLAVSTGSDVEDLVGHPLASSVTSAMVYIDPNAPPLPLIVWPVGLALLAAGTVLLRKFPKK